MPKILRIEAKEKTCTFEESELEFNKRAGFTRAADQLRDMFKETLPPHNTTSDFTDEKLQQIRQHG